MPTLHEIKLTEKDVSRFFKKVNKNGALWTDPQTGETSHCWEWTGARTRQGYGSFGIKFDVFRANRVAYFIANGEIQDELDVLHKCDNPPCCNSQHLFQGTHSENMQDMVKKGRHGLKSNPSRAARGERHGIHTHIESRPRGEKNGQAKLTTEKVNQIKEMRSLPKGIRLTQKAVAKIFDVSTTLIGMIEKGKLWQYKD